MGGELGEPVDKPLMSEPVDEYSAAGLVTVSGLLPGDQYVGGKYVGGKPLMGKPVDEYSAAGSGSLSGDQYQMPLFLEQRHYEVPS
jgi:hypothetical protein